MADVVDRESSKWFSRFQRREGFQYQMEINMEIAEPAIISERKCALDSSR